MPQQGRGARMVESRARESPFAAGQRSAPRHQDPPDRTAMGEPTPRKGSPPTTYGGIQFLTTPPPGRPAPRAVLDHPRASLDANLLPFQRSDVPPPCGPTRDIAAEPEAAEQLAKLGLSPESDLPAVVLTEPDGKIRIVGVRLTSEETARLATGDGIHGTSVVIYSSDWCPDCRRAKRVLEEAEAPFDEVDIDRDAGAEAMVLQRSGGRRVVPTLRFDDRLWAFNPAPPLLRRLLNGRAKPA